MTLVETIKVDHNALEKLQAYFEDYKAKQDLITMMFDLHKFDEESTVIESVPFKNYEKKFAEAKVKYDTALQVVHDTLVPEKYHAEKYMFNVNFDEDTLELYEM